MSQALPRLQLKVHEDRRLCAGHLWVFSNEVDTSVTPLVGFRPGDWAQVVSADGRQLGRAYVNPQSLICARLISRGADRRTPGELLHQRLAAALDWRQRLYPEPCYRWVNGEGDGLPGLVVDRYEDVLVVQATTAGMEVLQAEWLEALQRLVPARAIILRNDSAVRELEGLTRHQSLALGEMPEALRCDESDARFLAPALGGQKTGWYYDQRDNRSRLRRYASGARVLDLYCYAGGWGVQAALAGARSVTGVDSSAEALRWAERNAEHNGVQDRCAWLRADVPEALRELRAEGRRFDLVVLDPPAFIKRRKDLKSGQRAYHQVNRLALQVLAPGGLLVSCSCSHHLSRAQLIQTMVSAARRPEWSLQLVEQGGQARDHPIQAAIPETEYLKACYARLLED